MQRDGTFRTSTNPNCWSFMASCSRTDASSATATARCTPTGRIGSPRVKPPRLVRFPTPEQMVGGGAHKRYRVIAIFTPGPFTRQVHVDDRQFGQVVSPAEEHVADLGQEF